MANSELNNINSQDQSHMIHTKMIILQEQLFNESDLLLTAANVGGNHWCLAVRHDSTLLLGIGVHSDSLS